MSKGIIAISLVILLLSLGCVSETKTNVPETTIIPITTSPPTTTPVPTTIAPTTTPTPKWINNEPKITNEAEAMYLRKNEGITFFYDQYDTDTSWFKSFDLERYCTKGILVDTTDPITHTYDPERQGCNYPVSNESECVPDPDAPDNGATFHPDDMTCTTHYIHSRANMECLRTGEIFDYNDFEARKFQKESCPDCNWWYENRNLSGGTHLLFVNRTNYKSVVLVDFAVSYENVIESSYNRNITMFCTNNFVKLGNPSDVIRYIDKYYE